jgi:hypothetical protein
MLPLSKTESKIINYFHNEKNNPQYYGEVARSLNIPERTVYEAFKSLTEKFIMEKIEDTSPQEYRLTRHWYDVAEAARIPIAETDEAPSPEENQQLKNILRQFLPLTDLTVSEVNEGYELRGKIPKEIMEKLKETNKNRD